MYGRGNVPSFHPPSLKILDPNTGALKVATRLLVVSAGVAICEKIATARYVDGRRNADGNAIFVAAGEACGYMA